MCEQLLANPLIESYEIEIARRERAAPHRRRRRLPGVERRPGRRLGARRARRRRRCSSGTARSELPPDTGAVVLPGGFSYGDYLRCGAIARFSPVMRAVAGVRRRRRARARDLQRLPDPLRSRPAPRRAPAERVALVRVPRRRGPRRARRAAVHLALRARAAPRHPRQARRGLLVRPARARRRARAGRPDRPSLRAGENPNGAIADVAGVVNEEGNVMGLMPHPGARGRSAARLRRRGDDPRLARRRGARVACSGREPSRRPVRSRQPRAPRPCVRDASPARCAAARGRAPAA